MIWVTLDPQYPLLVVNLSGALHETTKNRSPVSQHSWHDKDPFLIIGLSAERRPKFCNFSQPKMTSPYDRAKKTLQIIKAFSYRIDIVVQASNTLFAVKDIDNVSINIHE